MKHTCIMRKNMLSAILKRLLKVKDERNRNEMFQKYILLLISKHTYSTVTIYVNIIQAHDMSREFYLRKKNPRTMFKIRILCL